MGFTQHSTYLIHSTQAISFKGGMCFFNAVSYRGDPTNRVPVVFRDNLVVGLSHDLACYSR